MSQKKKETAPAKKSVNSDVNEEEKNLQLSKEANQMKVSNWLLIMGIGAAVAVGTAATVYYYRRRKARLAYEDEDYVGYSIEDYKSSFNKYWSLTKKTFEAVTLSVTDFFAKNKNTNPLMSSEDSYMGGPFMHTVTDDDHEEVILCEL